MLAALEESTRAQQPARRRRVARAAHAADEPAHEHRGARAATARCRPASASGCSRDVVEQLGEMTTLIVRADRARARRASISASPRTCASTSSPPRPSSGRGATGPGVEFKTDLEESLVLRRAGDARPGGRQPARQRGQVEPARRRGRDRRARRRGHRPRPRPRDRRGGPAVRLRPLLPCELRPRAPRLGARPRDRPPGRAGARRHRRRGARRGRRHADALRLNGAAEANS